MGLEFEAESGDFHAPIPNRALNVKLKMRASSSLSDLMPEVGLVFAVQFDMANFVIIDRDTPVLLPPAMRDWVPSNHLVHFMIDTIESVDTSMAQINQWGTDSAQYPPAMLQRPNRSGDRFAFDRRPAREPLAQRQAGTGRGLESRERKCEPRHCARC